MIYFLAFGFIYGIFAVWFYAAVRPRFGAGPRTAACAGFAVWLIGYLFPSVGWVVLGLFPAGLMLKACAVGLVETILGTVAGAWLYKEACLSAARRHSLTDRQECLSSPDGDNSCPVGQAFLPVPSGGSRWVERGRISTRRWSSRRPPRTPGR